MSKQTRNVLLGASALALMTGLPMVGTVAKAGTTHKMEMKAIVLNGKTITKPYGFAQNNTMYMPIWYVMNTLEKLGIKSTWKNNVWNMKVPSTMKVDTSNISVGKGKIQLEINGQLMHKVDGIAATDPASGKPTTFIPIWYTQQLLKRIGISSPWDGTTWTLKAATTPVVPPPPTLPSNEVATWQFEQGVEQAFHIQPDATGTSPYDDIAATDSHFGIVQSAIEHHLVSLQKPTHSGAYEPISVQAADTMLWNAYGISDASFEPGKDPFDWANIVGLNPSGINATDLLSPQEFNQIMSNLADNQQGYQQLDASEYQIRYPIENEAIATFNGDTSNGQAFYTSNTDVQDAIIHTYQFYNAITVDQTSDGWVLSVPSQRGTKWFSYSTTLGEVNYQLPGDTTWTSTSVLDSRSLDVAPNETIRIKVPDTADLTISENQMLPQFGGTVVLGDLNIGIRAKGLSVSRLNVGG